MQNFVPTSLVATAPPADALWTSSSAIPPSPDAVTPGSATQTTQTFTATTHETIHAFDAALWNRLIPRDEPQLRHDFLVAAEASGIMTQPRYITVQQEGRLVGVAVAYQVDIDLFLLASPKLQRAVEKIRRGPLSRLGILRSLTCGSAITNCHPNVYLDQSLSREVRTAVARELVRAVDALAGGGLRLFFEHSEASVEEIGPVMRECGYVEAASLPGTRLKVEWNSFEEYVSAMRRIYRRAVRHDQDLAQDLEIRVETDFAHLSDEAYALYANVVDRAQNVVVRLTPEFFRHVAECEAARLVTAREKSSGRLIGIELLMVGEDTLQDLYTGVDYSVNAQYNLYFNLIYPGIALACEKGLKRVSTGQTSYEFKSRLGVEAFPLYIYMKHHNRAIDAFLHRFHAVICPATPTTMHDVFRGPDTTPSKKVPRKATRTIAAPLAEDLQLPVAATNSA